MTKTRGRPPTGNAQTAAQRAASFRRRTRAVADADRARMLAVAQAMQALAAEAPNPLGWQLLHLATELTGGAPDGNSPPCQVEIDPAVLQQLIQASGAGSPAADLLNRFANVVRRAKPHHLDRIRSRLDGLEALIQ